ncbi:MAG TPA: SRPBCC family protein [Flavobacteriales bacterium]|nr:SRPBCC family protein [Flavobacteriales bacterium]HMR26921.1 SRPBCC family protein [Flavobacteriales bacterium]
MDLTFHIQASPDHVVEHLAMPHLFASVHPLIERMEPLPGGRVRARERMMIGPWRTPLRFGYIAIIETDPAERTVRMSADVFGMARLRFTFRVRPQGSASLVMERAEVNSFLPIRGLMNGIIRKQHAILFANIERAGLARYANAST